jgi:cell division protein FtsW
MTTSYSATRRTGWSARAQGESGRGESRPSGELAVDHGMLAIVLMLVLFGLVMVYSASAVLAENKYGGEYHFLIRQAIWAGIGLVLMAVAIKVDYRTYKRPQVVFALLGVSLLLLLAVFAFPVLNGTHRWIRFGQASLQPSEIAKIALICYVAYFVDKRGDDLDDYLHTFLPVTAIACLAMLLVAKEPDLGTALSMGLVFVVMMYGAGARLLHLASLLVPSAPVLLYMLLFVPWRLQRLLDFLHPWKNQTTSGFQTVQALIALGSGGVTGLGLAEGRQKLFYLPAPHSDFIFAVVGEELGLIGTLSVLVVFVLLAWRGLRASRYAPDKFGQLLALGITVMIVAQAFFNMSVALSILPTKGIPLPFISCGGSSLAINLLAAGVLLNVSKHGEIIR